MSDAQAFEVFGFTVSYLILAALAFVFLKRQDASGATHAKMQLALLGPYVVGMWQALTVRPPEDVIEGLLGSRAGWWFGFFVLLALLRFFTWRARSFRAFILAGSGLLIMFLSADQSRIWWDMGFVREEIRLIDEFTLVLASVLNICAFVVAIRDFYKWRAQNQQL